MPNQMSTVPTQFFIDMASYLRHIEAFGTADQKAMAEQINKIAKQWMPPTDGVQPTRSPLTDEQVKERAAKAGLRWLDPIPDEDGGVGYPGGFDMSSLDEIRTLIAGVAVAAKTGDGGCNS